MEIRRLKTIAWLFGIVLLILIIFLPGYTKLQELRDRRRNMEEEISRLDAENAVLYEKYKLIQSDPLYQERVAREKMGVARKGEVIIKIEPEEE